MTLGDEAVRHTRRSLRERPFIGYRRMSDYAPPASAQAAAEVRTPISATGSWTGWVRRSRRGKWQQVCTAPAIGECSDLLAAESARRGIAPERRPFLTRLTRGAVPHD
jgi:hypothetical protein